MFIDDERPSKKFGIVEQSSTKRKRHNEGTI